MCEEGAPYVFRVASNIGDTAHRTATSHRIEHVSGGDTQAQQVDRTTVHYVRHTNLRLPPSAVEVGAP